MFCAIRYHLYNLKNMKNTHGGVLFLVTLLHGYFSSFLNCINCTKLQNITISKLALLYLLAYLVLSNNHWTKLFGLILL